MGEFWSVVFIPPFSTDICLNGLARFLFAGLEVKDTARECWLGRTFSDDFVIVARCSLVLLVNVFQITDSDYNVFAKYALCLALLELLVQQRSVMCHR